jgi:hypothetical protein
MHSGVAPAAQLSDLLVAEAEAEKDQHRALVGLQAVDRGDHLIGLLAALDQLSCVGERRLLAPRVESHARRDLLPPSSPSTDLPGAPLGDREHPTKRILVAVGTGVEAKELNAGVGERILGVLRSLGVMANVAEQAHALSAEQVLEAPDTPPSLSLSVSVWSGGHAAPGARAACENPGRVASRPRGPRNRLAEEAQGPLGLSRPLFPEPLLNPRKPLLGDLPLPLTVGVAGLWAERVAA